MFEDMEIAGWPPARIARLGIGRSYQRNTIFPVLGARELPARRAGRAAARLRLLPPVRAERDHHAARPTRSAPPGWPRAPAPPAC